MAYTTEEIKFAKLNARNTYKEIAQHVYLGNIRKVLRDDTVRLDTDTLTKICDMIDSGELVAKTEKHERGYVLELA